MFFSLSPRQGTILCIPYYTYPFWMDGGSLLTATQHAKAVHIFPSPLPPLFSLLQRITSVLREEGGGEIGPDLNPNEKEGASFGRLISFHFHLVLGYLIMCKIA